MTAEKLTKNHRYQQQQQGWQVSAEGGLNRFKPVRQKQVSASFCQCKF